MLPTLQAASFTGHTLPILANWSQFLGGFPLIAAVLTLYLRHTCHVHGCCRLAWHPHPGDGHPRCRHHHPHDAPLR